MKNPQKAHSHGKKPGTPMIKKREVEGILNVNSKGLGFVKSPDFPDKIEIDPEFLRTGMHGDAVRVLLHPFRKGYQQTGEIVEITRRGKAGFAGILEEQDGTYFLVPGDPKMYTDILIPKEKLGGAKVGEKVFGKIINWTDAKKMPQGEITRVLGKSLDHEAEMQAIALEKGFESDFPPAVEHEADELKKTHDMEAEAKNRRDFRGITTFTIDPVDAKDFDDALSFEDLGNGLYSIGVHIADVSHYVRPGSALDKEAFERGTSVYLVDRTIPMLPEVLSNDLCSLKPNEDRLTFSAVFEMNKEGQIKKEWFGRTIIHSDKRFSYEEAQEILDKKEGLYYKELDTLNRIAKELMKQRFKDGSISLDTEEVKFRLDENNVPTEVYTKTRGDTHRMIEDFMLLANRRVAEFIGKPQKGDAKALEKIFMYRVHDLPNKEKVTDLVFFLKKLGYQLKTKDGVLPASEINRLIDLLEGKEERETIHTAIIRSMAKAIYTTKNIGHFGLAFKYYTHFTSPIRRYPDLVVHRLLDIYLKGGTVKKDQLAYYEKVAMFASQREKEAAEAERASIKYKQVEYMSYRIGEVFDGIISGVTEWGIYVEEKQTRCEGMVRMKDIGDDFFIFNEKEMAIVGRKSKKKFRLGDTVRIKVVAANLHKKNIDYVFV